MLGLYEYQDASPFFQISLAGSGLGARGYFVHIMGHLGCIAEARFLARSLGRFLRLGGCGI
jgi:hypothetical protein